MFETVHPVIGTREIARAIAFYTERLFRAPPSYVGFRRDGVAMHMQSQPVKDPDALLDRDL